MIEELRDTYQTYLDLSHEERIEILKSSVEVIAQYCMDAEFTQEETFGMLAFIFRLFMKADESISVPERQLFDEAFGDTSEEDFKVFMEEYEDEKEWKESLIDFIDELPDEVKHNVLAIGLCVLAEDGKLTQKEIDLFEDVLL